MDFDLYESAPCDISGPRCEHLPHFSSFAEIYDAFPDQLPADLEANIRRCGYDRPTPVQKYAIPVALSGRDVMCCAQTGSGKTVAFLVPVLASMIKHHRATADMATSFEGPCKPDTLVISPTRELCLQIFSETLKLCHRTPFRAVRVYGQERVAVQLWELARGADVVVATPGRLYDFISSGIIDLTEVNTLVIDEADRIIAQGMEEWMRSIVEKFGMPSKDVRQTMMFSATFPESIQKLAQDYLYQHVWISTGVVGGASCTVTQELMQVDPSDQSRFDALMNLLRHFYNTRAAAERMMVFVNTKHRAKHLSAWLYKEGISCGAFHGDMDQAQREDSLRRFRSGEVDVLVSTDLASRGLDIEGVSHVVNYDLPREVEVYVQRIGRTGRIGHRGTATSFVAVDQSQRYWDEEAMLVELPKVMRDASSEPPGWLQSHVDMLLAARYAINTGKPLLHTDARPRDEAFTVFQ